LFQALFLSVSATRISLDTLRQAFLLRPVLSIPLFLFVTWCASYFMDYTDFFLFKPFRSLPPPPAPFQPPPLFSLAYRWGRRSTPNCCQVMVGHRMTSRFPSFEDVQLLTRCNCTVFSYLLVNSGSYLTSETGRESRP